MLMIARLTGVTNIRKVEEPHTHPYIELGTHKVQCVCVDTTLRRENIIVCAEIADDPEPLAVSWNTSVRAVNRNWEELISRQGVDLRKLRHHFARERRPSAAARVPSRSPERSPVRKGRESVLF